MALSSYIKTAWVNLTSPPINADNLNHIEDGIFATREQTITNMGGIATLTQPQTQSTVVGANPKIYMRVNPVGTSAQLKIVNDDNGSQVASLKWLRSTGVLGLHLFNSASGTEEAILELKADGHAYIGTKQVATLGDLDRPTIVSPYSATPTKLELIEAAKLIPHYSNDVAFWGAEHDFYIRDDPQTKMILVKYRGTPANTSETTAGNFFFEKPTKAT